MIAWFDARDFGSDLADDTGGLVTQDHWVFHDKGPENAMLPVMYLSVVSIENPPSKSAL